MTGLNTEAMQKIYRVMEEVPLFQELRENVLQELAAGVRVVALKRNDIIFQRGDVCLGFYVVMKGRVKLSLLSEAGMEHVVRLVSPGESFGEAIMFLGKDFFVTAQALAQCEVLFIKRDALFAQMDHYPEMARRMLAGLSLKNYQLLNDIKAHTLSNATQRLIKFLLDEWHGREGEPFQIDISKQVIASLLNISSEHLSRILGDLQAQGFLRCHGRHFTILDENKLRCYLA